jgi:DNA-binding response OmpR family regulator
MRSSKVLRCSFETTDEALGMASTMRPNVLIVDAALVIDDRESLLGKLRAAHGNDVPLIALCGSNADVDIAAEAEVTDIVRRPYDWSLIARRVVRAVKAHRSGNCDTPMLSWTN